jgi:hypothetical protein
MPQVSAPPITVFATSVQPPPDRFRLRDIWRCPDGHLHSVSHTRLAVSGQFVALSPIGLGARKYLRSQQVPAGWQRRTWGGAK